MKVHLVKNRQHFILLSQGMKVNLVFVDLCYNYYTPIKVVYIINKPVLFAKPQSELKVPGVHIRY
jgi:hypothetical protein